MSVPHDIALESALSRPAHEEWANSLTHGFGLVLSLAGSASLLVTAGESGEPWRLAICAVYVATLIAVYAASFLSHAVQEPRLKQRFRILDQAFIYLLIAGTYTPFGVAFLRGGWGWVLLAAMWTAAFAGCASKLFWAHRVEAVCIAAYVLLGWMPMIAVRQIVEAVPPAALAWIVAGGVSYTAGTLFLALDERVPFFHSVWHLCVIAGSVCHYLAVLAHVAQPAA